MTAALLDRPIVDTAGCRFPDWCQGSCVSTDIGGERNHWSASSRFWACDVDERIAVELYGYENDRDGIDPVRVYLAAGDQQLDEDGVAIPAGQASELGVALQQFTPPGRWPEDDLIHTALDDDGDWAVTAEYRKQRERRDGSLLDEHVELSIRPDNTRKHAIRVRLSLKQARALGHCLVEEADRADASNRTYGLAP